jgi:hypothetical protein
MKLEDALKMIMKKRLVWPNNGFLNKLIALENEVVNNQQIACQEGKPV